MNKIWFILIPIALLLFVPLFAHNEILKTIEASSDMEAHVGVITGQNTNIAYQGQNFIRWLSIFPNVSQAYLWFNFASLILVLASLTFVACKLINKEAALFVGVVTLFVSTGILGLFKYGVIFNIWNVYIILPFIILFLVHWINGNRFSIVPLVLLVGIYSVFHYSALYLPFILLVFCMIYILFNKKWRLQKVAIILGLAALGYGLSGMFVHNSGDLIQSVSPRASENINSPLDNYRSLILVLRHFTIFGFALLGIGIFGVYHLALNDKQKTLIFIMSSACIVLFVGLFFRVISDYNRLALDLSSMLAFLTACLIGLSWKKYHIVIKGVTLGIIVLGAIPNIITWVR